MGEFKLGYNPSLCYRNEESMFKSTSSCHQITVEFFLFVPVPSEEHRTTFVELMIYNLAGFPNQNHNYEKGLFVSCPHRLDDTQELLACNPGQSAWIILLHLVQLADVMPR